jgi:hypothetical protein
MGWAAFLNENVETEYRMSQNGDFCMYVLWEGSMKSNQ